MSKYLLYRDFYITLFNDNQKYLAVFVNDRGLTKVINYDDNFYSYIDDIEAYDTLIKHATDDEQEQQKYLGKFIKYIARELRKGDTQIDYDDLKERGYVWLD